MIGSPVRGVQGIKGTGVLGALAARWRGEPAWLGRDETSCVRQRAEGNIVIADAERDAHNTQAGLISRGFNVELVTSGEALLARCMQGPPLPYLVMEQRLPDGSGLELLPILLERVPGIRIVICTAWPSVACAVRAMRLGAQDYLSKPVSPEKVQQSLRGEGEIVPDPGLYPSLDRAIWEYINFVLVEAGTIAGAARRLRLDRRSLRRMLQKYPPVI